MDETYGCRQAKEASDAMRLTIRADIASIRPWDGMRTISPGGCSAMDRLWCEHPQSLEASRSADAFSRLLRSRG